MLRRPRPLAGQSDPSRRITRATPSRTIWRFLQLPLDGAPKVLLPDHRYEIFLTDTERGKKHGLKEITSRNKNSSRRLHAWHSRTAPAAPRPRLALRRWPLEELHRTGAPVARKQSRNWPCCFSVARRNSAITQRRKSGRRPAQSMYFFPKRKICCRPAPSLPGAIHF